MNFRLVSFIFIDICEKSCSCLAQILKDADWRMPMKQRWDCFQAEDDFEEGDVILENDEMMRQLGRCL